MSEIEKLRALLAEARMYLTMNGGSADDRIVRSIDAALAESPKGDLVWTDHPGGVDSTAFDERSGTGITIAPEIKGFRWYIKTIGMPVISSAWFDTMDEAKASAQMMVDAFRKGAGRGE